MKFMVDSGAHSFRSDVDKYKNWSLTDYEDFIEGYCKWLLHNRAYIFSAVELDIDSNVGVNIVAGWQERYFLPLQEKGLEIIYVWHSERGLQGWEETCSKFSYVGLPGGLSSDPDFNKYMTVARRYTVKVHGFAASVTGDSSLILRSRRGIIYERSIEQLFKACHRFKKTSAEEVFGYLPERTETWSLTDDLKSSFERISAVIRHRVKKPLYKITLSSGKSIVGTGDHSFFALNKDGSLREVKPSNLKKGDHLVSSLGIPDGQTTHLSTEDAEFYGLWFGDGYVNLGETGKPKMVWVSKQHQKLIRYCCQKMAYRRRLNWHVVPGTVDGYVYSPVLGAFIVKHFGRIGADKFIGSLILSAPLKSQAAFLRGYFSADGSAKGNNRLISLCCFRRDILEIVQLMLEKWDIRSSIYKDPPSEKGGITWELSISDLISRRNFLSEIGFIQEEQIEAVIAKNSGKAIAGKHRGLPVSLLKEEGKLFYSKAGKLTKRNVYAKDRNTAEIPENFCQALLDRECEYLVIKSVELVSHEVVDVYDLEVPATERFFANGILAHNTKQTDFRDWPWYSIDSITWKGSEMYGLLIDWDDNKQLLTFNPDKSQRGLYRAKFISFGLNADAIIRDKDYKEITKYALISMRRMEEFYEKKFADRLFYYDLRLPHPRVISNWKKDATILRWWGKFRPKQLFKAHSGITDAEQLRSYLRGISAVQYGLRTILEKDAVATQFLAAYWPKHASPLTKDLVSFNKDIATYAAPRNAAPVSRTTTAHYIAGNSPPKAREAQQFDLYDLEPSTSIPLILEDIL